MLQNVVGNGVAQQESPLVHSYKRSFNGFAAKLMAEEARKMDSEYGVVSVFPCGKKQLHTTSCYDFYFQTRNARKACFDGIPLPEWILKSREIGDVGTFPVNL
ncbi:unnamed protein product, partial [Prunus brigantina]